MAKKSVKKEIKKQTKKLNKTISTIIIILVLILALICYFYPPLYDMLKGMFSSGEDPYFRVEGDTTYIEGDYMPDVKVHFVDVGQGDCIIVELPDGKNVLIDSGEKHYSDLKSYIDNETSVKSFDYVIATHADYDHIGNFDDLFEDFEVKYIYRPYVKYTGNKGSFSSDFNQGASLYTQSSAAYYDFLTAIQTETYVENGEVKNCGWEFFTHKSDFSGKISFKGDLYEYYFDFLTPTVESYTSINYKNANDYSPIIKFSYQGVDVLFTGDAEGGVEGDAEDEFVDFYKNYQDVGVDVDILKVSHHGSETSTTQAFLDLVKPEYAVISCGLTNSYNHPRQSTLNRLVDASCSFYRTDLHSDVLLKITVEGVFTFTPKITNPSDLLIGKDAV